MYTFLRSIDEERFLYINRKKRKLIILHILVCGHISKIKLFLEFFLYKQTIILYFWRLNGLKPQYLFITRSLSIMLYFAPWFLAMMTARCRWLKKILSPSSPFFGAKVETSFKLLQEALRAHPPQYFHRLA